MLLPRTFQGLHTSIWTIQHDDGRQFTFVLSQFQQSLARGCKRRRKRVHARHDMTRTQLLDNRAKFYVADVELVRQIVQPLFSNHNGLRIEQQLAHRWHEKIDEQPCGFLAIWRKKAHGSNIIAAHIDAHGIIVKRTPHVEAIAAQRESPRIFDYWHTFVAAERQHFDQFNRVQIAADRGNRGAAIERVSRKGALQQRFCRHHDCGHAQTEVQAVSSRQAPLHNRAHRRNILKWRDIARFKSEHRRQARPHLAFKSRKTFNYMLKAGGVGHHDDQRAPEFVAQRGEHERHDARFRHTENRNRRAVFQRQQQTLQIETALILRKALHGRGNLADARGSDRGQTTIDDGLLN